MSENEAKIMEIIAEVFEVQQDQVTKDKNFVDDFNAKSIKIIEMCATLEDEFDIEIDMEDARKNSTVGDAIDYTLGLIAASK
ncbi:MAG: acyl carrier protein [Syntrophobacterales bacterium]|nr:acyl carrier protein [Syntrophobacterales bacterium]